MDYLRLKQVVSLTLILIVTALSYWPGLDGQFQFDDEPNIIRNSRIHITSLGLDELVSAAWSGDAGTLSRPVAVLSLAINYYFTELDPYYFKLTNLVIHGINIVLLFILCQMLLLRFKWRDGPMTQIQAWVIGAVLVLCWAVHPINLTSVLYVVQRMNSLSALFVFLGLVAYLLARDRAVEPAGGLRSALLYLLLVVVAGGLAVFSKENGALLFAYCLLIEMTVYRWRFATPGYRNLFVGFFVATVGLPVTGLLVYTIISPGWLLDGYQAVTAFSLTERVLTETRVLWSYMHWIVLPSNFQLALFHGDLRLSTGITEPLTTLAAIVTHLVMLALLVWLWVKKKESAFVFGVGFFYLSHSIESTVFPLQLIHEHRNYIGSFGLLLGIGALVVNHSGVLRRGVGAGRRWGLLAVAVAYALLLASVCFGRASLWGKGVEGALIETQHHPQSASSFCELGRQYAVLSDQVDDEADKEELMVLARQGFQRCYELDDHYVHGLFALLILDARIGKPPSAERMDRLTEKLATGPFSASYATWLMILSHCQKNDSCAIGKQNMTRILQSALNNPGLEHAGLTKSVALVATADFVANIGKNYSNALELSVEAAKESPGTSFFKRNVVELAIAFADYPTARKWIALLEQEHGWSSRTAIATLRNKLEAAEASKTGRHE